MKSLAKPKFDQGDVVAFETWPMTKIPRIGVVISVAIPWMMQITITKSGKVKASSKKWKYSVWTYVVESGKKNYSAVDRCLVKLGRLSP